VAIDGQGFLTVQTPAGPRYTRNGQLVVDGTGRLATATGYPVLDANGQTIAVGGSDGLDIDANGVVSRNGRTLGTLGVVSLTTPLKQGDTLFAGTPGAKPAGTAVRQGFLEGSGVDPTKAMVDMITSLRTYESDQKAISSIDETLQKGIQAGGV
jgi:flagellar basal-body rod protein FlgG